MSNSDTMFLCKWCGLPFVAIGVNRKNGKVDDDFNERQKWHKKCWIEHCQWQKDLDRKTPDEFK